MIYNHSWQPTILIESRFNIIDRESIISADSLRNWMEKKRWNTSSPSWLSRNLPSCWFQPTRLKKESTRTKSVRGDPINLLTSRRKPCYMIRVGHGHHPKALLSDSIPSLSRKGSGTIQNPLKGRVFFFYKKFWQSDSFIYSHVRSFSSLQNLWDVRIQWRSTEDWSTYSNREFSMKRIALAILASIAIGSAFAATASKKKSKTSQ